MPSQKLAPQSTPKPKTGPHWRLPWRANDPQTILIHARYDELKGTFKRSRREASVQEEVYQSAKRRNDHEAAAALVSGLVSDQIVDQIIDELIRSNKPARIVFPHPEFEADIKSSNPMVITNALPFAFAAYLAAELGCDVETEIVETARPGRTNLNRFERFLWQPSFTGLVRTDCAYVLVDDTCTLGGTFAALRSHIIENDGTVIAVSALTSSDGASRQFGIADSTVDVLLSKYTTEIKSLWIEEVGHDIKCLTETEGAFLVDWASKPERRKPTGLFQQLRDRLIEAAASGKRGDSA